MTGYSSVASGARHAFVYTPGSGMADLGTFGRASETLGYGINASGQVVGFSVNAQGRQHAFVYTPGSGMFDLGNFNGVGYSIAYGINDGGQVTGYWRTAAGGRRAYLYTPGDASFNDLGSLGGASFTVGRAVKNGGFVVGDSTVGNPDSADRRAFLYSAADGLLDLNGLLDALGMGWTLQSARGISANGYITGYGLDASGQTRAFLLAPQAVPEPASLLALGVGTLATLRRRKAR